MTKQDPTEALTNALAYAREHVEGDPLPVNTRMKEIIASRDAKRREAEGRVAKGLSPFPKANVKNSDDQGQTP